MLDCFEILTTSGVVLWSRVNVPLGAHVINSLINDVFIEEKVHPTGGAVGEDSVQRVPSYRHDKYTLKYTQVKELGLIFVVSTTCNVEVFWPSNLDHVRRCTNRSYT